MPKEVSTPKQSGGGGYTFADKVSASYLLKMLAGRLLLDAENGQIESAHFEKRVDGWFLDDLVLFLQRLDGAIAAVAISVKSNAQITKDGFPEDFTRAIWEQRLHVQTEQFDPNADYLALATSPLDAEVKSAWDGLITKAIDADPTEFTDRVAAKRYDNEIGRTIFGSLTCPNDIDSSRTPIDTTNLLKRVRHFQFDFESTPSVDENDCVTHCGELLRDGGQIEASSLWTHLKQIARSLATSGGDLTRTELADRLRTTFSLKEFPNYLSDWRKLSDDFYIRTERIRGTLAGQLQILRNETISPHHGQRLTALVGSSGSGKTVLAKTLAMKAAQDGHAIWLTSADLNQNNISELFSALGIRHHFPELVEQAIGHRGLIVIDGCEHLNLTGLKNLVVLLRRARAETDSSAWSFIFTCVVDLWDSTYRSLRREHGSGLNVEVTTVAFSFNAHRSSVLDAFPNMAHMLQRPNLSSLFGNLKILDLVLSNANEETNTSAWVGESNILDWYWTQHIQKNADGVARSRFAQKLACAEADQFLTAMPTSELDSDECRIATELQKDQVIWIREERFGFEHDLLGDWARTRFLMGQHEIVEVTRDKAFNPRWHRAIRLYGLRLLESKAKGTQQWFELVTELSPEGKQKVESDLILESLVFAANVESLLQQVWDRLVENNGALLARLLSRFLHVATLPDPRIARFSEDVATAALYRVPFSPLWLPVLGLLHEHRADSISLATEQTTKIADFWLKTSRPSWPLRDEAAQILIDAAHFVVREIRECDWRFDHDICPSVFSRFLTAAVVRPDEVSELALTLVERRQQSLFANEAQDESPDDERIGGDEAGLTELLGHRGPLAEPWPDGPLRRVNHEVHKGFLDGNDPLEFLFAVRPDVAKEVLLATLIREPLRTTRHTFHSQIFEFLHVETVRDWTPPMFFHGPFLSFLRINSEKGIETIVSLVNFVTDRWIDNRDSPLPAVTTTIDGKYIEYFGSSEAYYWYRDTGRSPHGVVPALMALERWLYLCLEQEKPIVPAVRQILSSSRSTAFLGVLAALGRKKPELFNDELRGLVSIWRMQVWEEQYKFEQLDCLWGMTMLQWSRQGESICNMVKEWHTLAHRKTVLGDVLFEQFVTNSEFRSFMKSVRMEWNQELAALSDSDDAAFLEKVSLRFDADNWKARPVGNGIVFEFAEPEERTHRLANVRETNERHTAVLTFPRKCRTTIDERRMMDQVELEHFWQQLRDIGDDAEQARIRGDTPEHAIIGGIAVLKILHKSWLDSDPEREMWCSQQLDKVLEAPPPHPEFHVAESISNDHWDNFAAMLIPRMLIEAPTHQGIRSLCAGFALAFNYSVIQDVMSTAFEYRDILGDDFQRLQHLILISSGMRSVMEIAHGGNSIWDCPDIEFDIDARFDELIVQFVEFEIPLELPRLVDIAEKSNATLIEMVRKQYEISYEKLPTENVQESIANRIRRCRGFEPLHIRAAFRWLENMEAAKDSAERTSWIDTLENLIHGVLRPLGATEEALFDEDEITFFAVPGQWDTWIFDLTANVIPKLEQAEYGHRLWQPILALGLDRKHWVDAFLSAWFIQGLRVEGRESNFFREWKEMIEYAWTRDNWRESEVGNRRSDDELFHHLMGFSSTGHCYIQDNKYRPFLASMMPEYSKWTDRFFPHPEATSAFAIFLTFPSAVDYLRDGVRHLAEVSPQFEEWHWDNVYNLGYALLKLLEYDWHKNSNLIRKDVETRKQFSNLLKTMTDRQVPRAMELQDRMMRAE
jgi:hypothetical protein